MDQYEIRESKGFRMGVHYVAANSGRIANEGEVDLKFHTAEGNKEDMCFQIAEVNKALAAVSSLVDRAYKVIFDKDFKTRADMSFMTNKITNITSRFRRDRNVWVLDAYVSIDDKAKNTNQHFHTQG